MDIDKYQQKLRKKEHMDPSQFRPTLRERFFPLKNDTFVQAKDSLLSFVFVREPFERLASSYYDKMNRDWSKSVYDLRWMRDEILQKWAQFWDWINFLKIPNLSTQPFISGLEALIHKNFLEPNQHLRSLSGTFWTLLNFMDLSLWTIISNQSGLPVPSAQSILTSWDDWKTLTRTRLSSISPWIWW